VSVLLQTLIAQRRDSPGSKGIYSVCSAHPWVLRGSIRQAIEDASPLLVEATSNQVNQQGGYTGMRPADFRELVYRIAEEEGFPRNRLILGGDHLGPNPWRHSADAMPMAVDMVKEYAAAGFTKLHLDASMPCGSETAPIADELVAERAAQLCLAAEQAYTGEKPVYVIGTEVPVPGGATESLAELEVTNREAAERTLAVHREVFHRHGLDAAWPRVIAMVVQPGVEFNHDSVVDYVSSKAQALKAVLSEAGGLVFEAHSTDYQRPMAYAELVDDGFCILKVGPALTFAMREVLYGLALIETELLPVDRRSNLTETVEQAMLRHPKDWQGHYHGTPEQQRILRTYSYSDRLRYYWNDPQVQAAVDKLVSNFENIDIPETLLSAYLPLQYRAIREGGLRKTVDDIVQHGIRGALAPYAAACFPR
jgi:D-tagatose-1,6-bisphosphate aldolase subunit GatZ/KbaZ